MSILILVLWEFVVCEKVPSISIVGNLTWLNRSNLNVIAALILNLS
jgi:hypothetical protein